MHKMCNHKSLKTHYLTVCLMHRLAVGSAGEENPRCLNGKLRTMHSITLLCKKQVLRTECAIETKKINKKIYIFLAFRMPDTKQQTADCICCVGRAVDMTANADSY